MAIVSMSAVGSVPSVTRTGCGAAVLSAVDLFCGAGGLTRGLLDAGVRVVAGIDSDPDCRYPYERNNGVPFLLRDVRDLDPSELERVLEPGSVRALVGCAPCQPYSTYSRSRRTYDARWHLLGEFGRLVEHLRPDLVALENVVPLQRHPIYADFVQRLEGVGYAVTAYRVRCTDYGVPQTRVRLVVFASLHGPVAMAHGDAPAERTTVRAAIGGLPPLVAGATDPDDPLHRACRLSPLNLERIRQSSPGGTWRDWDSELVATCHRAPTGSRSPSIYGRLAWDAPAPTVTTEFTNYGSGRFGHPDQDRALSLREGALLQTFPPTYDFVPPGRPVAFRRVARLIGNAVPVRLARAIGDSLIAHVVQHRGGVGRLAVAGPVL